MQEASLRALRYFRTFHRRKRACLVSQDRSQHLCGWRGHSVQAATDSFDEEQHSSGRPAMRSGDALLLTDDAPLIERAMSTCRVHLASCSCSASWRVVLPRAGRRHGHAHRDRHVPLSRARQAFREALENQLTHPGSAEDAAWKAGSSTISRCEGRASGGKDGSKRWKRLRFPQGSRGDPTRDGRWTKWRRGQCCFYWQPHSVVR